MNYSTILAKYIILTALVRGIGLSSVFANNCWNGIKQEEFFEECDNGIFNGTFFNNPDKCTTQCRTCQTVGYDLSQTRALFGQFVSYALGNIVESYAVWASCRPVGAAIDYGSDVNSPLCPTDSQASWSFETVNSVGSCTNGDVLFDFQTICCNCIGNGNINFWQSNIPVGWYCCGNEWKNKDGSCPSTPPSSFSYRRCGIGPSWYNAGSPSNPGGGYTTCSTETTLAGSYAIGAIVCRASQPSNSICGNTAPPSWSCIWTPPPAHSNTSTTTPSTNTNRTYDSNLGSACTRRCNSLYTENGGLCIPDSYQWRTCTAHNTWTALNSCTTYVYNPLINYGLGNFVCLNTTDPAPPANRCVVCSSNAGNSCTSASNNCGVSAWGVYDCAGNCNAVRPIDTIPCTPCVPNVWASCTSTNNNCSESNAGTVQCDGSCNAVTPPDRNPCAATPSAGICGDGGNGWSYDGHCLSAAPAINVNFSAHTWTCPGVL